MTDKPTCAALLAAALAADRIADVALMIISHPHLASGPCAGILSERNMLKLWRVALGTAPSALECAIVRLLGEVLLIKEME